jgi:peptidyl-prolyl cis-trans isomerase SurA
MIRLFLVMALVMSAPLPAVAQALGIAAVVNEDAISMADVRDRLKLIIISSGLPNNKDTIDKVMPQVLNGLIEEQIKLQEAERHALEVTQDDINAGLETLAQQNNMTREQFSEVMKNAGIPQRTVEHQIRAQIAWTKVIQAILRPRVDVSDSDVDARIARLTSQLGRTEYAVSQIFLPVGDDNKEADIRMLSQKLVAELKRGAPFPAVAAQFSKAPGAQQGGTLGWIQDGDLQPDLNEVLVGMDEQSLSDPIRVNEGYYILWLRGKRTLTEDKIPSREDITNMIGTERLDREQQRHLTDLKSSAFVDRRV